MKIAEIIAMSDEELASEVGRLRKQLFEVRSQAVTEKLADTTMVCKTKRDIARILTVIKEREIKAAASA